MTTERTSVNPVTWSLDLGFHQGQVVSGHTRTLHCAGQTSTGPDGGPLHEGDRPRSLTRAWTTSRPCSAAPAWASPTWSG